MLLVLKSWYVSRYTSTFTKEPRKDVDLQPTQRESQMRMQAVRIANTHRVEFLLLSTVTWEQ